MIQLSYDGALYSYDNKTSAVVTSATNISVVIHPYVDYPIEGSSLYYKQDDVDGLATIDSSNTAEIPGTYLVTGDLQVAVKLQSGRMSNLFSIEVTKINSSGDLMDDDVQFTLDNNKRLVLVPGRQVMLAVQLDNNSEIITFKFPRYQEGIDLSTKNPHVNYKRPKANDLGRSPCTMGEVSEDTILFSWTVDSDATQYDGIMQFQVEFTDDSNYRWQSQIAQITIEPSLYGSDDDSSPSSGNRSVGLTSVYSVNGKIGDVSLTAADIGAKPSSYEAPVSSVNGQTGEVNIPIPTRLSALENDTNFIDREEAVAAAPVQSINGLTGDVSLKMSDLNDDVGFITADTAPGKQNYVNTIDLLYSSWQNIVPINKGVRLPFRDNIDTFFSINLSKPLESGKTYTLSFDCIGCTTLGDIPAQFKLVVSGTSNILSTIILQDGRMSTTFTVPGGYTITRILFDDLGDRPSNTDILLTNFKVESGRESTDYVASIDAAQSAAQYAEQYTSVKLSDTVTDWSWALIDEKFIVASKVAELSNVVIEQQSDGLYAESTDRYLTVPYPVLRANITGTANKLGLYVSGIDDFGFIREYTRLSSMSTSNPIVSSSIGATGFSYRICGNKAETYSTVYVKFVLVAQTIQLPQRVFYSYNREIAESILSVAETYVQAQIAGRVFNYGANYFYTGGSYSNRINGYATMITGQSARLGGFVECDTFAGTVLRAIVFNKSPYVILTNGFTYQYDDLYTDTTGAIPWSSDTTYNVGDIVSVSGFTAQGKLLSDGALVDTDIPITYFKCTQNHRSSSNFANDYRIGAAETANKWTPIKWQQESIEEYRWADKLRPLITDSSITTLLKRHARFAADYARMFMMHRIASGALTIPAGTILPDGTTLSSDVTVQDGATLPSSVFTSENDARPGDVAFWKKPQTKNVYFDAVTHIAIVGKYVDNLGNEYDEPGSGRWMTIYEVTGGKESGGRVLHHVSMKYRATMPDYYARPYGWYN